MTDTLLRFNRNQRYVVFDTETEGLNLIKSRPWQVAWLIAEGDKIISRTDRFIHWPNLNVSEGAARVTGFSKKEYEKNSRAPNQVWEEFSEVLFDDRNLIVGQNLLGFDVYMVDVWRRQMARDLNQEYVSRIIDTKALATAIAKDIKYTDGDFINWQYKLLHYRERGLKTSQGFLLKHYGIDHDPKRLHDALYDIEMNFKIFKRQLFDLEL
jgi:DNA polymerase III alpha subunit (gram-positive type)|tara:strand:- start:941 stop:1573 length:633 start_codon:yes stop_codon:yes gene_type:complete